MRITYRWGCPSLAPSRDFDLSGTFCSLLTHIWQSQVQHGRATAISVSLSILQNQGQSASHAGLAFSLLDEVNYEIDCPRLLLGIVLRIPKRMINPRLLPKQHAAHLISSSTTAQIKGGAGCIGIFFTNQPRHH